jgi:hypothetical protein
MALLKQLQILDEEDRMKAALESVVEKKDPALKELVVRLTAIRCRIQSSKCSHLVPFARSETEATVLKNLSLGWALVASQTARYDEINGNARRACSAASVGGLFQSPPRRAALIGAPDKATASG